MPSEEFNISKVMFSVKKQFSHDANRVIGGNKLYFKHTNENEKNNEGEQTFAHPQRDNNVLINNYQKNINKLHKKFIQKYGHPQYEIPRFRWQSSFYDHVIRGEKDFLKHLKYIALNCVKHNVCYDEERYKWSFLNQEFKNLIDDFI